MRVNRLIGSMIAAAGLLALAACRGAVPLKISDTPKLQIIRLVRIDEAKFPANNDVWIAGKGYARVDGGNAMYMWTSATPPRIEIASRMIDSLEGKECQELLRAAIPTGKVLAINGLGEFKGDAAMGSFKLTNITRCGLADPNDQSF